MIDAIKIGCRVQLDKREAFRYVQPWRTRFEAGRKGTVVSGPSANVHGWLVEWDHGKVKFPHEWRMVMREDELVIVDDGDPA